MRDFTNYAWEAFKEGFVGALRLYGALVMAPFDVMSAFVRHEPLRLRGRD